MESLTPIQAIDALIGGEEQKTEGKERNKEQAPIQLPWIHSVTSYDPHGSHDGDTLKAVYIRHSKTPSVAKYPLKKLLNS